MDQRFWNGERIVISVSWSVPYAVLRIGFHFHGTKAERTEVVIIYDDMLDLEENGSYKEHLNGGKSNGFYEIFPLITIWMVLIVVVLQKSLLVDPCSQEWFEMLECFQSYRSYHVFLIIFFWLKQKLSCYETIIVDLYIIMVWCIQYLFGPTTVRPW